MLTTAVRPTGGTARVAGVDIAADPLAARLVSSVVFQETVLDRSLSGRRNLELHARLWRVAPAVAASRIEDLAVRLGLHELLERPVDTYSGGQRRRLEIARALVSAPEILYLDEPTVGLDPRIRAELLDVIAGLRDRSETTILLTTHYLDEAERLCDRVAVVHRGVIVALDTPDALRARLGGQIVELRVQGSGDAALATLQAAGVAGEDAFAVGSTLTVPLRGRPSAETVDAVTAQGVGATSITTREPTLDDVYLQLTGGRLADAA
jgi:ABC-2 type transport system ATP-binding protein